jgi:putative SOS response-associated peptidase YedK
MCGRYTLTVDPSQLMATFDLTASDLIWGGPRYNIAPAQTVAVLYDQTPTVLSGARWGLVPSWSKDVSAGYKMINARSETLSEKPSFRTLLKKKRCVVLADSFYEWRKNGDGSKTPMRFLMTDAAPFAFAGLWDAWKSPEGEWLRTCTIITTAPNPLVAPVHDRMPAILAANARMNWLNPANDDPGYLTSLLGAYPADAMRGYPVSSAVGSVKNDRPELIEELP